MRRSQRGMETRPAAVVMNLFYTGLGIARSLGERGIPVIGLTARHGIYGNFSRYAKTVFCPDSRKEPEALLAFLLEMGKRNGCRNVIFPTRDDDVVFLDRFRNELEPYYVLTIPAHPVVEACLDKWKTCSWAQAAGVATPACWLIGGEDDLARIAGELSYPCVIKPVSAHHWHQGSNWAIVGGRKAVCISSWEEMLAEYREIARADKRALVQEMVPGGDECLVIAAVYLDRSSNFVAGFNTQKLVQSPAGFGTGCIVQNAEVPELFGPAIRVLQQMHFTGIAEVEFKWDAVQREFKLIEINPRPWDQHRLGNACGVDLIYLAYAEHAGLPLPAVKKRPSAQKWIAEDAFLMTALQALWRGEPALFRSLWRQARDERVYAVWSALDPLPALACFALSFIPNLIRTAGQAIRMAWIKSRASSQKRRLAYRGRVGSEKSHG